eukprot:TRINITY_DN9824_c0_g1_i1.p1 TRINITY_DN9824_c0_g1~~TRINITY_DN9824_c0_g1_i1.p1  ORF type:complete len:358 (-),score=63.75 TRINITY_DN9824_c0_g1_i1:38-1111(-)
MAATAASLPASLVAPPWGETGRAIVAAAASGLPWTETGGSRLVPGKVAELSGHTLHAEVCRAVLDARGGNDDLPPHPMLNKHDEDAGTVLHWAVGQGLREAAVAIVECRRFLLVNARLALDGSTALHIAAYKGLADVVAALLARPDFTAICGLDGDGFSALHGAAYCGQLRCARLLLEDGRLAETVGAAGFFDVPRPLGHWTAQAVADYDMSTALHMASAGGHVDVVDAILSLAPDTCAADETNRIGATALHLAARAGHTAVVSTLLKYPAFTALNAHDARGFTALHWVAHFLNGDVCAALLARQDFTALAARDLRGRTALDIATSSGHYEVKRLILDRMGPDAMSHGEAGLRFLAV